MQLRPQTTLNNELKDQFNSKSHKKTKIKKKKINLVGLTCGFELSEFDKVVTTLHHNERKEEEDG